MNSNKKRREIGKPSRFYVLLGLLVFGSAVTAEAQRPRGRLPQRTVLPSAQPEKKPAVLKIHVDETGVTAEIVDCPMQAAFQELAERTGIIFEVRSHDNPLISLHLSRADLTEAIRRMASGRNTILLYGKEEAASPHIALVRIFSPVEAPQPSIIYLGTGRVTKTGDDIETPEQALRALMNGEDIEMREKAIDFLVSVKSEGSTEAMLECISDPAPEIRSAAIEGLAALNARGALPVIINYLRDAHAVVRRSAATAVALLGDSSNVNDLKPLIFDKDANVAAAAEMAVRKLSAAPKR